MSRRTETAYKAQFLDKLVQHDKALDSGNRVKREQFRTGLHSIELFISVPWGNCADMGQTSAEGIVAKPPEECLTQGEPAAPIALAETYHHS